MRAKREREESEEEEEEEEEARYEEPIIIFFGNWNQDVDDDAVLQQSWDKERAVDAGGRRALVQLHQPRRRGPVAHAP